MLKVYGKSRSDRQKASVCRLCMARHSDAANVVDIFIDDPEQNHVLSIIRFCIGIECVKEDGLPPHICDGCHRSLSDFFAFKSMCLASEVYLKRINAAEVKTEDVDTAATLDVIDVVPENALLDELSLAENNDMVLLETDDVTPGTPYEVLRHFQESVAPAPSLDEPPQLDLQPAVGVYEDEFLPSQRSEPPEPTQTVYADESVQPAAENDFYTPSDGEKENFEKHPVCKDGKSEPHNENASVEALKTLPAEPLLEALTPKAYSCKICLKPFRTSGSLARHGLIHDGKKPHSCTQCGKQFTQKESLKRHLVSHSDLSFVCSLCCKSLKSKEGLKCHMRTHHSNRNDPSYFKYKCKYCDKCFAHSSGLSRHSTIHKGVTFSCDICPRKFTDKSPWKKHREKHLKETSVSDKGSDKNCIATSDSSVTPRPDGYGENLDKT